MKKEVENAAITSSEEKINNLILQLVIEAKKVRETDYKFQLVENILEVWKKIDEEEINTSETNLTSAEIAFASRLSKFLEYYKKDILFTDAEYWKIFYGGYNTQESFQRRITSKSALSDINTKYYNIILAMFSLFNNHSLINLKTINTFIKSNLNSTSNMASFSIGPLYSFFYKKLNFKSETDFPVFTHQDNNYKYNLMQCKQFKIFMEVHSKGFRKTETFKTAIAAIWVINRYF